MSNQDIKNTTGKITIRGLEKVRGQYPQRETIRIITRQHPQNGRSYQNGQRWYNCNLAPLGECSYGYNNRLGPTQRDVVDESRLGVACARGYTSGTGRKHDEYPESVSPLDHAHYRDTFVDRHIDQHRHDRHNDDRHHHNNRHHDERHYDDRHHDDRHYDDRHNRDNRHHDERHYDERHYDDRHHDDRHYDDRHNRDNRHHDERHYDDHDYDDRHRDVRHHESRHHDFGHYDDRHHDDRHHDDRHHDDHDFDNRHHDARHHESRHHDFGHYDEHHHDVDPYDDRHHDDRHHDAGHYDERHYDDYSYDSQGHHRKPHIGHWSESFYSRPSSPHMFYKEALKSHNIKRALHGVAPLRLSSDLNEYAENYAEELARKGIFEHSACILHGQRIGENLAYRWTSNHADYTVSDAVQGWYNEINDYDFTKEDNSLTKTGHFSQLVWRESAELGVGKAHDGKGQYYIVASYRPPGNKVGTFHLNVLPPLSVSRHILIH